MNIKCFAKEKLASRNITWHEAYTDKTEL